MKKTRYIRMIFLCLAILPISAYAYPGLPFRSEAHVVWVMISTLLILFMTIPGIALFYGGMVQRKNVLSIYAQCVTIAAIVSIIWFFFGYSLAFSSSAGLLPTVINHFQSLGTTQGTLGLFPQKNAQYMLHVMFEMGFAIITVAIIVGGFAERMKFSVSIIFITIWLVIVYCPVAHWVWASDGWLRKLGMLDFAGGTVVHLNAGIAGLIAALMLGQRRIKHNSPHSLSLVTIGTSILWFGWFGFNAGSANTIPQAILAILNTQLAPAGAALGWMATEWLHRKKPSARGLLFGVITGLVMVTPMAGLCSPPVALIGGIVAGFICYWATTLKRFIGYDDALDAFGIHGVAGILGAVLTGVAVSAAIDGIGYGQGITMMDQVGIQLLGVLSVLMWSGCCSFIILYVLEKTIGLRVVEKVEMEGLDYHEHGEVL